MITDSPAAVLRDGAYEREGRLWQAKQAHWPW